MKRGVILTDARSWEWVLANIPPEIDTIKVVTGWGLSWTHELRLAVFARFKTVIVRTRRGDLDHAQGAYFMPDKESVVEEVRPWFEAWNGVGRLIIQIGNEPLLVPVAQELIAWQYAFNLREAVELVLATFPGVETMAPAQMLNHWVALGARADGQRRWCEISRPALASFSLLAINAYTADQVQRGVALYRDLELSQPIWISELNLNEPLEPVERGRRLCAVTSKLRPEDGVEGATVYHLVDRPDNHPIHSNPHYTVQRETLAVWSTGGVMEPESTPAGPRKLLITWVGMTRRHYQPGEPERIRSIVIHATAGRHPGDLEWLRKGGDERRPVSCHYYIDKSGRISQLVKDGDIAWHAGASRWEIDGRMRESLNSVSVGIELENLNTGKDPYPDAQLAALIALTRGLVQRHNVPASQLVRHLDISPGRKTDPAGFPWSWFTRAVFANDPWAAWGEAFPIPTEQRAFAIPQRWLREQTLGAATGPEVSLGPNLAIRPFACGLVVWVGADRTEVVRF